MSKTHQALEDMLYQALETELGGVKIYEKAIRCAIRDDLKSEWTEYLRQTTEHVEIARQLLTKAGFDPDKEVPGRKVIAHIGNALVEAMDLASKSAPPESAQIVAAECVVLAETKDHANWELIGRLASAKSKDKAALTDAYDQIGDQEDEHLYHTKGWARELWLQSFGLPAVLPPPEEVKHVTTAIGAARAESSRDQLLASKTKQ